MKKECFKYLKKDQSVFFRVIKSVVHTFDKDNEVLFCIIGDSRIAERVNIDEVFISSPSIEIISNLVFESWEFLRESFDSSLLNPEIKRQFIVHWKNMCEADGNMDLYKIAFDDFAEFQKELLEVVEKAKDLRVANIPLLKEN